MVCNETMEAEKIALDADGRDIIQHRCKEPLPVAVRVNFRALATKHLHIVAKKPPLGRFSDGFPNSHGDHQKVPMRLRQNGQPTVTRALTTSVVMSCVRH
jgi:hypothetical protein